MYHTLKVQVTPKDPMYDYLDRTAHLVNNLYNAALFRCRQVLSARDKAPDEWTENEKEVMAEVETSFPGQVKRSLGYGSLDRILRDSHNPDFFAEGLSKQTAQQTLKAVAQNINGFFEAIKAWNKSPEKFLGKPELPHYRKKGGKTSITFTNQDCALYTQDGRSHLRFPLLKEHLCLGDIPVPGRLMEVKAKPFHGVFLVLLVFDDGLPEPELNAEPSRICAIDFGVSNFAAISNNVGLPFLLFKGGVLKSQNQWYNKKFAQMKSEQTKGTTSAFTPTLASEALCLKRENQIIDFARKFCKRLTDWCLENQIDTIVVGKNVNWKQESSLGKKQNQEFVQMPFDRAIAMLKLKASQCGIRVVEQEESYTSQASYPDRDVIPVYGKEAEYEITFSGKRKPTRYKGAYKKDGFRGLYTTGNGSIINSDLNGSANIGRKAFPEKYGEIRDESFDTVQIILHPDYEAMMENRKRQLAVCCGISKSKQRRLMRKAEVKKCNPIGIVFCE